jgi:hypothetical protein
LVRRVTNRGVDRQNHWDEIFLCGLHAIGGFRPRISSPGWLLQPPLQLEWPVNFVHVAAPRQGGAVPIPLVEIVQGRSPCVALDEDSFG